MSQPPYPYQQLLTSRYTFTSVGLRSIIKMVEFTPLHIQDLFNLGFGDLLPNGCIDDKANSNNGDISQVLATVIDIVKKFTAIHSYAKIVFTGSTPERTIIYKRILTLYYQSFRKEFTITALVYTEKGVEELLFDPAAALEYNAFFIKRIS